MSTADFDRAPWNWPAVFMFLITTVPVLTVFPWYAVTFGFDAYEVIWCVVLLFATGLSITGGYHRLWAHRAYEAHPVLKVFYMLFGAMSLQNSILIWASMHRVHHRHVDDEDHDPYSARRGLWFSHMGWMLKNYPSSDIDYSNARDLKADPIVMFQHRHYLALALAMNIGLPLLLGLWHGDVWGSLLMAGLLRLVISHHVTFFINSLAHYWGRRPYTVANSARDNDLLALVTYGEGYHNYHHLFQWDYRNGIRWWQYDPTKWLIAACSRLGLARNLKRVPEFVIRRAMLARQFEAARERLAKMDEGPDKVRLANLQLLLEHEWQHYSQTLAEWTQLQGEKFDAAKQQLADQWESSEVRKRLQRLESALKEQYQRVRLLHLQAA
ncbi:fatty acid desaturase [Flagellatimonas centrodinii]|uniref:acyl-CoA desaturase n=1 Tax=Flagellatimonas centrodinii TaxID=2806210 RepID=UPI001FEF54EF|nr:fatty acid desaturase [Flagellatimonas centrodinii]ULQ45228.1 fatty acid desaturase [Flagellatimonas centrodinii]